MIVTLGVIFVVEFVTLRAKAYVFTSGVEIGGKLEKTTKMARKSNIFWELFICLNLEEDAGEKKSIEINENFAQKELHARNVFTKS